MTAKLKTAHPPEIHPEKPNFTSWFDNDFLSDCILEANGKTFKCHRIVLAAASNYLKKYFEAHPIPAGDKLHVKLPNPVRPAGYNPAQHQLANVIKSLYSQVSIEDMTKSGLNKDNVLDYYSYFHALESEYALHLLDEYINKELSDVSNSADLLLDGVKFDAKSLKTQGMTQLVKGFSAAMKIEKQYQTFLKFPVGLVKEVLARDDLQVEDETLLIKIVTDYITMREGLPTKEELQKSQLSAQKQPIQEIVSSKEEPIKEQPVEEPAKPEIKAEDKPEEKVEEKPAEAEQPKPDSEVEKKPEANPEEKPVEEKKPEEKPEENKEEAKPEESKPDASEEQKPEEKPEEKSEEKKEEAQPEEKIEEKKPEAEPEEKPEAKPEDKPEEKKIEEQPQIKLDDPKPDAQPKQNPQPIVEQKPEALPILDLEEQAKQKLALYRLSDDEKAELVRLIRFPFLSHEAIIKASETPVFSQYKDIFLEALSSKLSNYEHIREKQYRINTNPRASYENSPNTSMRKQPQSRGNSASKLVQSPEQKSPFVPDNNRNPQPRFSQRGSQTYPEGPYHNESQFHGNGSQSHFGSQIYKGNPYSQPSHYSGQMSHPRTPFGETEDFQKTNSPPQRSSMHSSQVMQTYPTKQTTQQPLTQSLPPLSQQKQYPTNQFYNSVFDQNHEFQKKNQSTWETPMRASAGPYGGGSSPLKVSQTFENTPIEFRYKFDFDDNGALYWLGSCGKTKAWQNPYKIGQVKVFFSSLGKGNLEDFVGRECVNCRTLNEPNSYMGVDLGVDRSLIPLAYTIRNRNSSYHVMLNWALEGSINGLEWYWLDKRIHLTTNEHINAQLEREREELKRKGYTSTWAIDPNQVNKIKKSFEDSKKGRFTGFRYFKITQIGPNSGGSDNMALSGFEIYGTAIGENWFM